MSSQKSRGAGMALEPKRQRGRNRVAAILEAAATVFGDKGYDAATMTEIAARADTAIGSLYRFFPSKEVLAEALLERYAERALAGLDAVADRAEGLTPAALADVLVDTRLAWQPDQAAAAALLDIRVDAESVRTALRRSMRGRIAAILRRNRPTLAPERAERLAFLTLHILKAIPLLAGEPESERMELVAEIRTLARLYLESALAD
jgi:AcrR family transcriptional regulator